MPQRIDTPIEDGTTPISHTPEKVTAAQKQLTALQWASRCSPAR